MGQRVVILSDLQVPYQHAASVAAVIDFIRWYKPDQLWCVGDELDAPEPSRWNKGMAGEYSGTLQKSIDETTDLMAEFRSALGKNKPFIIQRSNHTDRIQTYISKYGPALTSLRSLEIEELLGYNKLDIEYLHGFRELLPGWIMAHGDEGRAVQVPGSTALALAKRLGKSVVCGHTHKLGLQHDTTGFGGKMKTRWGLEVGNLMDIRKAHYLTANTANWHHGIGILVQEGSAVVPYAVPIVNGEVHLP